MNLCGVDISGVTFETMGRVPSDAEILADNPDMLQAFNDATEAERQAWLAERRQDPIYTMEPAEYKKFIESQREMAVAQSGAGMSQEARGAMMQDFYDRRDRKKFFKNAAIFAGVGVAAYFVLRPPRKGK